MDLRLQVLGARWAIRFGWLLFLALVLVLPGRVAWAHGGGTPRLTNVEAGPYWVSVWTQPDPLRVGQVHVTLAVSEPTASQNSRREAGPPVLDTVIQVRFEPVDPPGETLSVPATHEDAANKLFYEADLELPETGRWRVVVNVDGPDGSGSASFEVQVSPATPFNLTWLGGLGVVALAGLWVAHRYRNQQDDE